MGAVHRCLFLCLSLIFQFLAVLATPTSFEKKSGFKINKHLYFPQAISTNPNTIRIPFKHVGRLVAVEAQIDTVKGTFFFDTGADKLLLNKNYFNGTSIRAGYRSFGATGKDNEVITKQVDTLNWDNLRITGLNADVLDLSHLELKRNLRVIGIIGYQVFKDYEILLDYPFHEIILTKLDKKGNRLDPNAFTMAPFDSIDFKLKRHGIIVEASVLGINLDFNLDTGAELNLIDRKINKEVLKQFKILKRTKLMGAGNRQIEVLAGMLSNVVCGKQRNPPMRTLVTNLSDLNQTYGTKLDGVMGFEFFRPRRTLINYKKKKIYFFELPKP